MTDLAFTISAATLPWQRLRSEVHAWRGEMLQLFALAEREIGEVLHAAGEGGTKLHLVSQKTNALAKLIAKGGPHASIGGSARGELDAFATYSPLRSTLTHGHVEVTVDEVGNWIAIFRLLTFGASGTNYEVAVFSRSEAAALSDKLQARVDRLVGQLCAIKRKLSRTTRQLRPSVVIANRITMQPAPETTRVTHARVACDGASDLPGGAALGHPRVWLQIDETGFVDCGYCDRRFILVGGPADAAAA